MSIGIKDYRSDKADLTTRFNHQLIKPIWVSLGAGLGFINQELDIKTSSQTFYYTESVKAAHLEFGGKFILNNGLSINHQIKGNLFSDLRSSEETTYLRYSTNKHIGIDLGYKRWFTRNEKYGSHVKYELEGPWLAIVISN